MINDDLEQLANRGPHRDPGEVIDSAFSDAAAPNRHVQPRFLAVSVVAVLVACLVVGLASLSPTDTPATTDPAVATPVPTPSEQASTNTFSIVPTETLCSTVAVSWPDRADGPLMVAATIQSGSIGGRIGGYQLATDPFVFLSRGLSLDDVSDLTAQQQAATVPVTVNGYATEVRPPATGTGAESVRFVFPPTASPDDPCNVWMIKANSPMDVDQFVALLDVVEMELVDEQPLGSPSNPEDRLASWPAAPAVPTPVDDIPYLFPTAPIATAGTPVRAQFDGGGPTPAVFAQVFADEDRDIVLTLQTQPNGLDATPAELRQPLTIDGWDEAFATTGALRIVASDPSGFVLLTGTGIDNDEGASIIESMQRRPDGIAGWDPSPDAGLVEINAAWNESAGQRSVTWFDGNRVVAQILTSPAHTNLISQTLSPIFERVDVNGTPGWLNSDSSQRSIVWSPDGSTIAVLGVVDDRIDPVTVAASVTALSRTDYESRTTTEVPAGVGDGCAGTLFC
jgi:hypothetical protein